MNGAGGIGPCLQTAGQRSRMLSAIDAGVPPRLKRQKPDTQLFAIFPAKQPEGKGRRAVGKGGWSARLPLHGPGGIIPGSWTRHDGRAGFGGAGGSRAAKRHVALGRDCGGGKGRGREQL